MHDSLPELGELEREVMQLVWAHGPVTAEAVERLQELRHAAGRHDDVNFTVGALMGPTYVGDPDWDLGGPALAGSPEKLAHVLRKMTAIGVHQVQIRLRSRSAAELVDQIGRFGAEVGLFFWTSW